jgi:rRNA maturation protein Nop10
MGANYDFRCGNCSLSAEVSGGPDSGMYAEWTTVWCPDCKSLSDATTASEDREAEAEYRRQTVALPDNLRCPRCWSKGLRTFDQNICPRCGEEKAIQSNGSDWFEALFVCETCETSVKRINCQPKLYVNPKDVVEVRLYCDSCDSYPVVRKRIRGAYVPPPEWKKHELKCRKCDSTNVQTWSAGNPCPSCGGKISRSRGIAAFTD